MTRFFSYCLMAAMALTITVPATATNNVAWLDFSGWDPTLVTADGQTFVDICDDVDVTVTGTPGNTRVSFVDADGAIRSGGDFNNHSFTFTFSEPVPIVVSVDSLDSWEVLNIINSGGGAVTYTHSQGAVPSQSGNLTMTGTGHGQDLLLGASQGLLDLGLTSSFTWDYTAMFNNKYERFMVGKPVPEPGTISLVSLAGLSLLGRRRRL